MMPVSRVNKKSHFLKLTTIATLQNLIVFIPTGKTVIVIGKLLAERELSLRVEGEFLGVLQMETF
jgi:hypothetical protein